MKKEQDNIGIRSEKIRRLIGEMPGGFIRYGTVVIIAIFLILIIYVCSLPFPFGGGETIGARLLGR